MTGRRGSAIPPVRGRDWQQATVNQRSADWPAGWPATPRLNQQLASLTQAAVSDAGGNADAEGNSEIIGWATDVSGQLSNLRSFNRLSVAEAGTVIDQLPD